MSGVRLRYACGCSAKEKLSETKESGLLDKCEGHRNPRC